jgi:anti-sigma regulatory factor (Ser/Thr protein kinase)/anti-anti-sigma regulatory factor
MWDPQGVRSELAVRLTRDDEHDVLRLRGPLSLATMLAAREALGKLLADRGRVVVDLSELQLEWQPAVQVFPAALATAGGWPGARLVLCAAPPELALALRVGRVTNVVPLVAGLDQARSALLARPRRVSRHVDLPCHSGSPGGARSFVRELCSDWEIPQLLDPGEIVVTELVSNAVEHARSSCRLTTAHDRRGLHVGVRDFGAGVVPRVTLIEVTAARGRGLQMVAALSTSWGVSEHADGKTVWATLSAANR